MAVRKNYRLTNTSFSVLLSRIEAPEKKEKRKKGEKEFVFFDTEFR